MKKLLRDIGIVGTTDFLRTVKALIIIPILTKTLGAAGYGIVTQIRVTIMVLTPMLVLGLDEALIRFISGEKTKTTIRNDFLSVGAVVALFSIFIAALFYVFAHQIAFCILGNRGLFSLIRLLSVLLLLYPIDHITTTYYRTFRQIKNYFLFLNSELLVEIALITSTVFLGHGIEGVLLALIACKALFLALKCVNILIQIGPSVPTLNRMKEFIGFGMPLVLAGSFYFLINYGDRYVIRHFLGIESVGVYAVGYTLGMLVIVLMTPFDYVLYPRIAAYWNNNELDKVKLYMKKILSISVSIAVLACLALIFFAKRLVVLISTESFVEAASVVPYVSVGFLIFGVGIVGERIISLLKKTKVLTYVYAFLGLLNITLNIIFVPRMGIKGAALATFITFVSYTTITLGRTYRYLI